MLWIVGAIAVLLLAAALYDVRAKRRGTYRTAEEWQEITSRRKTTKRDVKKRKEPGTGD